MNVLFLTVPTDKVIQEANEIVKYKNNPRLYLNEYPYLMKIDGEDIRKYRDKDGVPLLDVMITVPENYSVQIHELKSDVPGFSKAKLRVKIFKGKNAVIENLYFAYFDGNGLDFKLMKNNQSYCSTVAELLSLDRIAKKDELSKIFDDGNKVIYVGNVYPKNGNFTKFTKGTVYDGDNSALRIIDKAIQQKLRARVQKQDEQEKAAILSAINEALKNYSLSELQALYEKIKSKGEVTTTPGAPGEDGNH